MTAARGRSSHSDGADLPRGIPDATVARLPLYLRALNGLVEAGVATVSSEDLSIAAGVTSAKLRKDLSYLGSYGTRGVGYDVELLLHHISREIGMTQDWPVVIVGIGNLGRALAKYSGFASRGFRIAALLDDNPAIVGTPIRVSGESVTVRPYRDLGDVVKAHSVCIGVIAVPAAAAQDVADRFVEVGITSILNFAPAVLVTPEHVAVRKVDLATELQILAYHEQRRGRALDDTVSPFPAAPAQVAVTTAFSPIEALR